MIDTSTNIFFFDYLEKSYPEIKKIKTLNDTQSNILKESNRHNEFIKKLLEWTGGKNLELIYRGTRDGMNNKSFYDKCSNKGPTLSLIKTKSGIDTYRNELSEISKRLDKLFGPVDLTYRMAGLDITEKASERVIMEYDRR